jgi:hypothetical protein
MRDELLVDVASAVTSSMLAPAVSGADAPEAGDGVVDRAVGEGEAGDVHPGHRHLGDDVGGVGSGTDRGDDASPAVGGRTGRGVAVGDRGGGHRIPLQHPRRRRANRRLPLPQSAW